jgi:ubiquinone/menaquinone biosynthesis C-methylase UbiE
MAVYDKIADGYKKSRKLPICHYVETYSLFQIVGDLSGQSVLDLACGEGIHTRNFRKNGATQVVGVDISEKMINLAKQEEAREPLDIKYQVQDVLTLGKIGGFDLVTAAYLLNYAKTREELLAMCKSIYVNLKIGGRFVSINSNFKPDPDGKWKKYGLKKRASEPLQEGAPFNITCFGKDWNVSFDNYYLSKDSYEWAFQQAGFKSFCWHDPQVSPESIKEFGEEFWQDAIHHPVLVGIECVK